MLKMGKSNGLMNAEQAHILEDIFKTLTTSQNPEQSLEQIVQMVAERFAADVCSVYVYDPSENKLVLKATVGLNRESVGAIEMDVHEGLTGLVIEKLAPVFVVNPSSHPRFKYYDRSGEEIYRTYLGMPLIFHQKVLGAMVIQTISEDGISESDIPLFSNIAGQISATVAYTGLLVDRSRRSQIPALGATRTDSHGVIRNDLNENYLRGISVSESVAEGFAYYLPEKIRLEQVQPARSDNPLSEIERLESAFALAAEQISEIHNRAVGISEQDSAIIDVHMMLLRDKVLRGKVISKIKDGDCAEYALKQVIMEHVELFESMDDPYLSERSADVLDIGRRILGNLLGISSDTQKGFDRQTIVIASDIPPVQLLAIRQPNLKGIVLAKGGLTSHTVIMAKSLEIPIVIGVDGLLERVRHRDYVIIDGASGLVYPNPSENIRREYARRKKEGEAELLKLLASKDEPAVTQDGSLVRLGANIGLLSDIALAQKYGADHIGLYRTEFPFLLRKSFPTEEEQVVLYTKVLEKVDGQTVNIRTFDVGGDKFLSYLDYPHEDNPFLGWRSIRISLDLEDVFRTQIRAILRASPFGKAQMLFPMITGVEEIRRVVELVDTEKRLLKKEGISFDENIPLGIMVEVPAAVPILDRLLRYVDFVSIGTNDLIQYLLAVDRNNKKVAGRYDALHPSVLSTINQIISICRRYGKTVEICGEAASKPECIQLFLAMGADHISMSASAIPAIKAFIRNSRISNAREALEHVLTLEDADHIRRFMSAN